MTKLIPKYSYEFNKILNETFDEDEQIKNFASLLSDKDRYLQLLQFLEQDLQTIQEHLGFNLREEYEIFIIRAEKFKSFSDPITIEYSVETQEMILFTLKEILKISIPIRFPDETLREQFINAFIEKIISILSINKNITTVKFLHEESQKLYSQYKQIKYDLDKGSLKQQIEDYYEENPLF